MEDAKAEVKEAPQEKVWACSQCTFQNTMLAIDCAICNLPKDGYFVTSVSTTTSTSESSSSSSPFSRSAVVEDWYDAVEDKRPWKTSGKRNQKHLERDARLTIWRPPETQTSSTSSSTSGTAESPEADNLVARDFRKLHLGPTGGLLRLENKRKKMADIVAMLHAQTAARTRNILFLAHERPDTCEAIVSLCALLDETTRKLIVYLEEPSDQAS